MLRVPQGLDLTGGVTARNNTGSWGDYAQLEGLSIGHAENYLLPRFSYPLENGNCNDYSNSLQSISADFARMKSDYGATMVRIYAPECRDISIWKNILQAGIDNNM